MDLAKFLYPHWRFVDMEMASTEEKKKQPCLLLNASLSFSKNHPTNCKDWKLSILRLTWFGKWAAKKKMKIVNAHTQNQNENGDQTFVDLK